jgi:protein-disulfide isomerase
MKKVGALALLVTLIIFFTQPVAAQTSEDMKALRNDIQELKKGQEAIKKDIEELKGLLQRPTAKAAPPAWKPTVVSTDDDPFLGKKTAKLTIIEFADYQ